MLMTAEYINYFGNQIKAYMPNDLDISIYDSFNYDDSNPIKFTIIRLAGTIDSGTVSVPYQIMCEVDSKYAEEVRKQLDEFAFDKNETSVTLDSKKYKQRYSTSYTVTNFQKNGLVDRNTIAINAQIISFGDVTIDSFVIDTDDTIELENIAISYAASAASAGAKTADNGKIKRANRDVAVSYSIMFIPKNTATQKAIAKQAIFGTGINTKYTLKIKACGDQTATSIDCVMVSGNITKAKNGVMAVSATFMAGDFDNG